MFFSVKNPQQVDCQLLKIQIMLSAQRKLFLYPYKATEQLIDTYLLKTFGVSLKTACLQIFLGCKMMKSDTNELLIVFQDPRLDTLASVITYGPDGTCGSNILKNMFSN